MADRDDTSDDLGAAVAFEVDRRDHRRVPLHADVVVRRAAGGRDSSHSTAGLSEEAEFSVDGRGGDISVGGMYLVARDRLAAGSMVELEFELDVTDRTFFLRAEVRWTRRLPQADGASWWAIGLEFDELDPKERQLLDDYVLRALTVRSES